MYEFSEPTNIPVDVLKEASKRPMKLYETLRAMRDNADTQLNTGRVFTCVAKFGESVLGDALAIFDEVAFPLIKQASVGDVIPFKGFSLSIAEIEEGSIRAHVIDPAGTIRFQVDWDDKTAYDERSLTFRKPPAGGPGYHSQEPILSAKPQKDEQFGVHPIALGFLDYPDYFQAMEAVSVIREELIVRLAAREPDPEEFNLRRMNLKNYEDLLSLDCGVAGPACHWAISQMVAQSTKDALAAAAQRFLRVLSAVEKLDVEWGKHFFNYHRENAYLTLVPTEVPGRKALFDLWISWSFKHPAFLAVLDTDAAGEPTEISFSLLSRGNGEFNKVAEAAQTGHFEGMPVARYSYVTGEVIVPREFYEKHGFEVITAFMRHTYKALREFNDGKERIGKVVSNFNDLLCMDDFEMDETLDALSL
jgi:hypothetical protein